MISGLEVRKKLSEWFEGRISLDEFEDWLAAQSWDVHKSPDPETARLVYAIELRLAEHSSGHLSQDELRRELAPLLQSYELRWSFCGDLPVQTATGTSSTVSFHGSLVRSFDTQPGGVFA